MPWKPKESEGVKVEKMRPAQYKSSIDQATLFADARNELEPKDPDAYPAFLLALGAGLRKSEIDGLKWHIGIARGAITGESTEYRDLETEESAAVVERRTLRNFTT